MTTGPLPGQVTLLYNSHFPLPRPCFWAQFSNSQAPGESTAHSRKCIFILRTQLTGQPAPAPPESPASQAT